MKILFVSPQAPPKNSPESIQVGRYLKELDKNNHITLVTTPVEKGWVSADESLNVDLLNTNILIIKLPYHKFISKIISSKYFKYFRIPDKDFWIKHKSSQVLHSLTKDPDIIYSRSMPFSSALLAFKLKRKTKLPWVMHLSDPIFDNPYRDKVFNDEVISKYELVCFQEADFVTLTTFNMAKYYKEKYPLFSNKIHVSPNVMPLNIGGSELVRFGKNHKLRIIYAGALYGRRNLTTVLDALQILRDDHPDVLKKIDIRIIGNISENIKQNILNRKFKQISLLGRMQYSEVLKAQESSDIVMSIEPSGKNPILKSFLPSKILDYLATRKPILAITPEGSESWDICNNQQYGWAIEADESLNLSLLLKSLTKDLGKLLNLKPNDKIFHKYSAQNNANKLLNLFKHAIENNRI